MVSGSVSTDENLTHSIIRRAALGRTTADSEVFDAINIEIDGGIEAHQRMCNMGC